MRLLNEYERNNLWVSTRTFFKYPPGTLLQPVDGKLVWPDGTELNDDQFEGFKIVSSTNVCNRMEEKFDELLQRFDEFLQKLEQIK